MDLIETDVFVYLLQRFSYVPHTNTFLSIGSSEHSGVRGIKHDRVEGAFVLCQGFHSVVATYIVNEDSPIVAGAGKYFVIVRMNGQSVDRLLVQKDVEGFAPATIKAPSFDLVKLRGHVSRIVGRDALRAQIMDYDLIVIPRREYLGLAAVVTKAKYIANVLRFHHRGLAHTLYRLLHSP